MSLRRPRATARGLRPAGGTRFRPVGRRALPLLLLAACQVEPRALGAGDALAAASDSELDPASPILDAVELDRGTAAGLAVLHARGAGELLSRSSSLRGPAGPVAFGAALALALELRNPFPDEIELLLPEGGYGLEFRYTVMRLLPDGTHETTRQIRHVRLDELVRLAPGSTFRRELPFELGPADAASALWEVRLELRFRLAGLRLGERELPLADFEPRALELLALPPGWETLRDDPLGKLVQAAALASPLADRHLLVAAVLLPAAAHDEAVRVLAEALPAAPTPARAVTIAVALERLTGLGLGAAPQRWIEWWGSHHNGRP